MATVASQNLEKIVSWFKQYGKKAIVALSGGVDSAVVALAAKNAFGQDALAITANSDTFSMEELHAARSIAKEINISHMVIHYKTLENSFFVKNDSMRCYHCRTELAQSLLRCAQKFSADLIVDGTHLDDASEYRPGLKAMRECGIRSPLVEVCINKSQVRSIAKEHHLSVYNKPSNSCLASRLPHGTKVTADKLRRIEKAESNVRQLFGVNQVRVRDHSGVARIEVGKDELAKLFDTGKLATIDRILKSLGFMYVSFDAKGYRTGNLVIIED